MYYLKKLYNNKIIRIKSMYLHNRRFVGQLLNYSFNIIIIRQPFMVNKINDKSIL